MGMIDSDLTGIHQQHAAAQTSFNDMLRLVVLLEALPWLAASTLATNDDQLLKGLNIVKNLPEILIFVLFFTGIAGLVGLQILIHNRLNIIFYARAINGFRAIYSSEFPGVGDFLPLDKSIPPARDRHGIMILVAISLSIVNGFYFALASYSLTKGGFLWSAGAFIVTLIATRCIYINTTKHAIVQPIKKST